MEFTECGVEGCPLCALGKMGRSLFGASVCGNTLESKEETPTVIPSPGSRMKDYLASENVLEEANRIIHGPRRNTAGHPQTNFARIAAGWSVVFGVEVSPHQVGLAMIWHKICREVNSPARDNIVDIAGYAGTYEMLDNPDA